MTKPKAMRDARSFIDSMNDFNSWIGGVVPGATDIDFMCERGGNFLFIELKHFFNGIEVPYGQHVALYRLANQPNTTVYLLGEDKYGDFHLASYNSPEPPLFRKVKGRTVAIWVPGRFRSVGKEEVRQEVEAWWEAQAQAA